MPHSPEAALAIANPPSCISEFRCITLPAGELDLAAEFALSCKACGGDSFQILAYPLVIPDPSPHLGFEPGETLERPPHRLRCTACSIEVALFDARTQGYDGVLNGGCSYESGDVGESPISGAVRIVVSFLYNIEQAELIELATEANVKPSDLFDAFVLTGTPVDGSQTITLDYECA